MDHDDKINAIAKDISEINVTLAKQAVILEEHVRRTNLLESRLTPIEHDVSMIHGIVKFIGFIAVLATIIEMTIKLVFR